MPAWLDTHEKTRRTRIRRMGKVEGKVEIIVVHGINCFVSRQLIQLTWVPASWLWSRCTDSTIVRFILADQWSDWGNHYWRRRSTLQRGPHLYRSVLIRLNSPNFQKSCSINQTVEKAERLPHDAFSVLNVLNAYSVSDGCSNGSCCAIVLVKY